MYYFFRALYRKLLLKVFSVVDVRKILRFVQAKILSVFDSTDNLKAIVKAIKSLKFGRKSSVHTKESADEKRVSGLAVAASKSVVSKIKNAPAWLLPDKKLLPDLYSYDIKYIQHSTADTSRLPALIGGLAQSAKGQHVEGASKVSRYFKMFGFLLMFLMLFICAVTLPFIHNKLNDSGTINGSQLEKIVVTAAEQFLLSPNQTPPQFGNINDADNLWSSYNPSLMNYKVLKRSNTFNFTWVVKFQFFFNTTNSNSIAVQTAYILDATVDAQIIAVDGRPTAAISVYKPWATDFNYYYIPSILGSRFWKTTNSFLYRSGPEYNPATGQKNYAQSEYYFSNYSVNFAIHAWTINPTTFTVGLHTTNITFPILSDTNVKAPNFDYTNYNTKYNSNFGSIVIAAFKGDERESIQYSMNISITFVDFKLILIQKPTLAHSQTNQHLNQNQSQHQQSPVINSKLKDTTFPRSYTYKIADINDTYSPLLSSSLYTRIHSIGFFLRMRMHTSISDATDDLDTIPKPPSFWPIYVCKFQFRFCDSNYVNTLFNTGYRWVNGG